MLNKKNIACLIFVFLSLKIYAEDDFNVISQCTDEYETSCDLVLINGNEKNIFFAFDNKFISLVMLIR